MNVVNAVFPPADQAAAFFGGAEDGPFVMVNLLKFKERARVAVTGRTASPGLFEVLVLLGRERTLARLQRLGAYLATQN